MSEEALRCRGKTPTNCGANDGLVNSLGPVSRKIAREAASSLDLDLRFVQCSTLAPIFLSMTSACRDARQRARPGRRAAVQRSRAMIRSFPCAVARVDA